VLELGGNAAVIVDRTADVEYAVKRIIVGGFGFAGQSCISVQRIFVHEAIAEAVRDKLVSGVRALRSGDPLDPTTDVGPMVDTGAARRTAQWVDEAVGLGGRILAGGHADGAFFEPT